MAAGYLAELALSVALRSSGNKRYNFAVCALVPIFAGVTAYLLILPLAGSRHISEERAHALLAALAVGGAAAVIELLIYLAGKLRMNFAVVRKNGSAQ